jgi:hypothetical protein
MADKQVNQAQVIWAVVLILAGLGVFYRIPQVMPTIEQIPRFAGASGLSGFVSTSLESSSSGADVKKLIHQYRG